jgi:hypothetical protein
MIGLPVSVCQSYLKLQRWSLSLHCDISFCWRVKESCKRGRRRLYSAGDTAWAPKRSEGRTAESAGLQRRNAQLRWAMRGQDLRGSKQGQGTIQKWSLSPF